MPNSIASCVDKLVTENKISPKVAKEALGLYERMNARYSGVAAPASSEAAAALATARALRTGAAEKAAQIANDVRAFKDAEQRVVEHPAGRNAGLMGLMTKDMFREAGMVRDLPAEHPVKQGLNVDYLHQGLKARLFNMFGAGMEAFKPGFLNNAEKIEGVRNMVRELFGKETGDQTAKVGVAGWKNATDKAVEMAKATGKRFAENEDWRLPQAWTPRRVAKVSEDEFVRTWTDEANRGGVEFWDKDANAPVQTAARQDFVLRRAYNDIKGEGGGGEPFSKDMRTFRFKDPESYLRMQDKFGVGNDVLAMMTGHLDHMAKEVAISRIFGSNPQATFAALLKRVKEQPGLKTGAGVERFNPVRLMAPAFQTEPMLRNTFKVITGETNVVHNEVLSSVLGGARDLIGASSLRNLPISIIPSDTVTTLLAANHIGMSGFKILGEITDGTTSKEAAAHLQVNSHSAVDYINNSYRKYEDELNYSGMARKVSRGVVKATGAELWTEAGRRASQTSFMNQIAEMRDISFGNLDPKFKRFLDAYGFDAGQWNRIRSVPVQKVNDAKYYLNPEQQEPELYQRLLSAVQEQSSYAFHQPDARTRAITTGGTQRGTAVGEVWRSMWQYKQFALERMTTHLMRVMVDGPIESRVARGTAFMAMSTAAGALSLQAANIVAGKDPASMSDPKFWVQAFVKGGGGGIYGDLLASGLKGDRSAGDVTAEFAGPLPGLASDVIRTAAAPMRQALNQDGTAQGETKAREAVNIGRRFTPNTWYTKLAIDRMFWDKLQTLVDPDYRGSFRRSNDAARKQGTPYWWGRGEAAPSRLPGQ